MSYINELTGYDLSRNWFDFCFDNPEKIKPAHTALYFFIIEHCNRMGWKEKFGLPMEMAKDAIGIKNYKTYSKAFDDLVSFGFIKVIERSKNQYSANIVALVKNTKASTKALSKAMHKHSQKQVRSIVGIDKPITLEPITLKQEEIENWDFEKRNFLEEGGWMFRFCTEKKIDLLELESLMKEFIVDTELREDFKTAKDLRNHFTNKFNLDQKNNKAKSSSRKLKKMEETRITHDEYFEK